MLRHAAFLLALLCAGADQTCAQPSHPTLSTMWVSTTDEPGAGVGLESYYMVDQPTTTNPSAMWSNYSADDCFRLIYDDGSLLETGRYLIKCDAIDCCEEDQEGNQIEFQIPNVHPARLAPVKYDGKKSIVITFGENVTCDVWSWHFLAEKNEAYTVGNGSDVRLVRWGAAVGVEIVHIDFAKDYKNIPESQRDAFKATFAIPPECAVPNLPQCDSLRARGLLKEPKKATWFDRFNNMRKKLQEIA